MPLNSILVHRSVQMSSQEDFSIPPDADHKNQPAHQEAVCVTTLSVPPLPLFLPLPLPSHTSLEGGGCCPQCCRIAVASVCIFSSIVGCALLILCLSTTDWVVAALGRRCRDRRRLAEEMLARLARASGRRISRKTATSRRLEVDVICCSDGKIFRVDAVAPGHGFADFLWKHRDVTIRSRPPSQDTPRENGEVSVTSARF